MGGLTLLRETAAAAAHLAASLRLLDLLERSDRDDRRILRVVTYHRILAPGDASVYPGVVSTTPEGRPIEKCWIRGDSLTGFGPHLEIAVRMAGLGERESQANIGCRSSGGSQKIGTQSQNGVDGRVFEGISTALDNR